jgi:hypothetical protein
MTKQTAVEWIEGYLKRFNFIEESLVLRKAFEKAKEMEKKQKIEFAKRCLDKALDLDVRTAYSKIEQYYQETFKSE